MTVDPRVELSDQELTSLLRQLCQENPDIGQSMALGTLRATGYKVTRARIQSALRSLDPLSAAIRRPGGITTRRRVYSVAAPNLLWHIGIYV